jgi:hypothetical protein
MKFRELPVKSPENKPCNFNQTLLIDNLYCLRLSLIRPPSHAGILEDNLRIRLTSKKILIIYSYVVHCQIRIVSIGLILYA